MALRLMQAGEPEDPDLVAATLAGDGAAFELLVTRYQGRLFGLVRHYLRNPIEVEDVVQDTFLKAFTRLDSFQQQSSFYTWLHRIAVNTVLDFLKRRGRSPVQAVEDPELLPSGAASDPGPRSVRPDARLEREEIARITHEVLASMPEIFSTVLILREFEGRAYQEISETLGISIGTVESRLFRARNRFKQALTKRFPEFVEGS